MLFRSSRIVRIRSVLNNLETYLGIVPTLWIGGADSIQYGEAGTIIPGLTTIYHGHIVELQQAISRIESRLDGLSNITVPHYLFESFADSSFAMVQYIESILQAILLIETIVIEKLV